MREHVSMLPRVEWLLIWTKIHTILLMILIALDALMLTHSDWIQQVLTTASPITSIPQCAVL